MTTLNTIQKVQTELDDKVNYLTYLNLGPYKDANVYGLVSYQDKKDPAVWDKIAAARELTGVAPTPVVSLTEEDYKWKDKKILLEKERKLDDFIMRVFRPYENPVNMANLEKIMPDWAERQIKANNDFLDFKREIDTLRIRGPKNIEEFYKLASLDMLPSSQQVPKELINKEAIDYYNSAAARHAALFGTKNDELDQFQKGLYAYGKHQQQLRSMNAVKEDLGYALTGDYEGAQKAVTAGQWRDTGVLKELWKPKTQ